MKSDFLKIIAVLTMVVDHIGRLFNPPLFFLLMIGRLALPIFAMQIAAGSLVTKNLLHYFYRLFAFGLLSQPFYMLFFDTYKLNIFFTLAFGLLLIIVSKSYWQLLLVFLFLVFLNIWWGFSFGIYGILMVLLFYYQIKNDLSPKQVWFIFFVLTISYSWFHDAWIQMFSLGALVLIYYAPKISNYRLNINKYCFYAFYPMHLIILWIIKLWLKN